jgi:glutathione peroxidase
MTTVYDFSARTLAGQDRALADFRGQALLIVNVASRCGFTPQYEGLQALQDAYGRKGFAVLGFPCDQFGHQEPGDAAEIERFCTLNYDVSFPMFAKIEVNGPGAHPLFAYLKAAKRGLLGTAWIKWNFTKFLVGRDGRPIARYAPKVAPETLAPAIEAALR